MPKLKLSPTSAGRHVLRRITQGAALLRDSQGFVIPHPTDYRLNERIHPLTVFKLDQEGYVEHDGRIYRLTAAGRAAVEAED